MKYKDVFVWLYSMPESDLITRESNKNDIINRCSALWSKWHSKQPTNIETAEQISNNLEIASIFKAFMNDDAIPDPVKTYYQYLKYREVETILKNMSAELKRNNQSKLEISNFIDYMEMICKITANSANAVSILINYCWEHHIKHKFAVCL
ncbi:MAG: hypothetical protein PUD90_10830 [Clostridia bacterium]|nr:hypothetical protein [Clostridia bacterium]